MYKGVLLFQTTILLYFLYYRVWGTLYSQIFSRGTSNERIAKPVSAQKAVAIILPRQGDLYTVLISEDFKAQGSS